MSPAKAMIGYLQSRVAELEAQLAVKNVREHCFYDDCWVHGKNPAIARAEKAEAELDVVKSNFDACIGTLAAREAEVERLNNMLDWVAFLTGNTAPSDDERCARCGITWEAHADYLGCFFFRREGGGRESGSSSRATIPGTNEAAADPAARCTCHTKALPGPEWHDIDCPAARKERDG